MDPYLDVQVEVGQDELRLDHGPDDPADTRQQGLGWDVSTGTDGGGGGAGVQREGGAKVWPLTSFALIMDRDTCRSNRLSNQLTNLG